MNKAEITEKIKAFMKKAGKKTLIAACAVLVLGGAVTMNFVLRGNRTDTKGSGLAVDLSGGSSESVSIGPEEITDYFAMITLQRRQARDEAMEVLKTVTESQTALDDAKQAAYTDISRMASDIENEANIETLIRSKGFEECVAVIKDGGCSVIVQTNGLLPGDVAQISEIVYEQAGIAPDNLKIIEKGTEA